MTTPAPSAPAPAPTPPPPWRPLLAGALAVAGAVAVAYGRTLDVPFVFDDVPNIVEAPGIHLVRLDLEGLGRAVAGFPAGRWLARLSLALDYHLWELRPAGYHAVNLCWHLLASLLAGLLSLEVLSRLDPARSVPEAARGRTALLAALLFAVHPVQTQAVTYVVQRMTSMGGALGLLACWLFLRSRREGARARPLLAGAALASYLAFACKETYAALPLLAILLEWLLVPGLGERLRRRWPLALGAAALAALGAGALAWRHADQLAAEHARFGIPVAQRLLSQGAVLLHYLSLLALPLPGRLHVDYYWPPAAGLLEPPTTLPALLLVAGLAGGAVALRRRAPLVALAGLWFLLGLAVEQTILPIDLVFEHRLYLPSLGLLLLAAVGIERLGAALPRPGAWLVGAPLVALLAAGTVARNEAWRDPAVLLADDAGSGPGASRGLISLGTQLRQAGRLDEAAAVLRRALLLEPRNLGARVNLANVLNDRGDKAGAEAMLREVVAGDPAWPTGWYALGAFLLAEGRTVEARACLERAAALAPEDASIASDLGVALARLGEGYAALAAFEKAIRLDPGNWLAWLNRGEGRLVMGDAAGALADGRQALALQPGNPVVLGFAGDAAAAAGLAAEARGHYQRALAASPGDDRARRGLARLGR